MRSILFVAPQAKFFLSHRLALALAAREAGYGVAVACPWSPECDVLREHGIAHFDLPVARASHNPLRDLNTILTLNRVFSAVQPSLVHLITAKATLYGGLLARIRGVPTVAAITGLGFLFVGGGFAKRVARFVLLALYRIGLNRRDSCVIFQNASDLSVFAKAGILRRAAWLSLPGAGVDLRKITAHPLPPGSPVVVLPARMLRMKGVEDFRAAAAILEQRGVVAVMRLVGDPDTDNPTSLTRDELRAWDAEGTVEWQPHRDDIDAVLAEAHVVALPSHGGEGLPKTLVDAAAAGRAVVATDVPGCRDAVLPGVTGLLCRPRDPVSLADALQQLLTDPDRMRRMGEAARREAERRFDIETVRGKHLEVYDRLSGGAA